MTQLNDRLKEALTQQRDAQIVYNSIVTFRGERNVRSAAHRLLQRADAAVEAVIRESTGCCPQCGAPLGEPVRTFHYESPLDLLNPSRAQSVRMCPNGHQLNEDIDVDQAVGL